MSTSKTLRSDPKDIYDNVSYKGKRQARDSLHGELEA